MTRTLVLIFSIDVENLFTWHRHVFLSNCNQIVDIVDVYMLDKAEL
jgi:hypothetical protein